MSNSKTTRKSNGSGSIYYDEKRDRWCAEIQWKDKNGETHRKKFSGQKKTIVKNKLDEFRKQLLISDGNVSTDTTTFEEYARYWLEFILKNKLKPTSFNRKEVTLENQVFPNIGNIPIEKISFEDIQDMVNTLNEDGLSYSTIKKAYEAVNGCIKSYMVQKKRFFINPCEGVSLPKANQKEISDVVFFDKSQRKLIEKEAIRVFSNGKPFYRMGYAIVLLMYTGIRVGEMLALTWEDIDFKEKTISINKNAVVTKKKTTDGEYKYVLITQNSAKTKSGARIVPMTQKAYDSLTEIKKITGNCQYVISSSNNKQLSPRNINRMFHNILTRVGIMNENESFGVHTLRHTFASMLFQNGCNVKVVSELLGHSDTKITENIYIHLIQQQKVRAIQDIDQFSDSTEE